MVTIVQIGDPVLETPAAKVPEKDIAGTSVQQVIKEMRQAVASQNDGVAIAAPQIGKPLRIFVVAARAFEYLEKTPQDKAKDMVFINPIITKRSKKQEYMEEGCLSVRWLYGKVKRAKYVTVRAFDETGRRFTWNGSGVMAQIFQHEIDHLDGVLFTEKAIDVEDLPPKSDTDHE